MPDLEKLAEKFDATYDHEWEATAAAQRREFRKRFPVKSLKSLTLEQYAIGQNKGETYCHWLETGTRMVALIAGSPASKFGIYYGVSSSSKTKEYRYTRRYSEGLPRFGAQREVFESIKKNLLDLVRAGQELDFAAIDKNPLAPMLKAKALCLHFPEKFLAICSKNLLLQLSERLGLETESCSEIQHKALMLQEGLRPATDWSQFKFMDFLYSKVLKQRGPSARAKERAGRSRARKVRSVDFRKLMELWAKVGKESEAIAWKHEKSRLRSEGLGAYVSQMEDCTMVPSRGFDFVSFTAPDTLRFIEVKTFTEVKPGEYRFFLSTNEKETSESEEHADEYYFYLVMFDSKGARNTKTVKMVKAQDFYNEVEIAPQGYVLKWPCTGG